jgi:hypothetical protein
MNKRNRLEIDVELVETLVIYPCSKKMKCDEQIVSQSSTLIAQQAIELLRLFISFSTSGVKSLTDIPHFASFVVAQSVRPWWVSPITMILNMKPLVRRSVTTVVTSCHTTKKDDKDEDDNCVH